MLSDFAFFTPLDRRIPLPAWYLPSFLLVGILSTLAPPEYRTLRTVIGGLFLGALVYNTPKYTTGGVNSDFVVGLFVSGITLKFWEFLYYRQAEEYAWRVATLNPLLSLKRQESLGSSNGSHLTNGKTNGDAKNHGDINSNVEARTNGEVKSNADAKPNGHVEVNGTKNVNGETKGSENNRSDVKVHGKFNTVWEKLHWSVSLWTTTRGVEWNWGIKDLMPVAAENLTRL